MGNKGRRRRKRRRSGEKDWKMPRPGDTPEVWAGLRRYRVERERLICHLCRYSLLWSCAGRSSPTSSR